MTGALLAFGTSALVIVILLFGLAYAIASAQDWLVETLRSRASKIKHGGGVLIGVGLWFLALAIWADTFADLFPV
ncbi:hypothetical protein BH23CHL2_BH23CHL2_25800 [soil metagenome]